MSGGCSAPRGVYYSIAIDWGEVNSQPSEYFPKDGPQPKECLQVHYGRDGDRPVAKVFVDGDRDQSITIGPTETGRLVVRGCQDRPGHPFCGREKDEVGQPKPGMDMASLPFWTGLLYTPRVGMPGLVSRGPGVVTPKEPDDVKRWADNPDSMKDEDPAVVMATLIKVLRDKVGGKEASGNAARVVHNIYAQNDIQNRFWDRVQWGEAWVLLNQGIRPRMESLKTYIENNTEEKESLTPILTTLAQAEKDMVKVVGCMMSGSCQLGAVVNEGIIARASPYPAGNNRRGPFSRPTFAFAHPTPAASPQIQGDRPASLEGPRLGRLERWLARKGVERFAECMADPACADEMTSIMVESSDPNAMGRFISACLKNPLCAGLLQGMAGDFREDFCRLHGALDEICRENQGGRP